MAVALITSLVGLGCVGLGWASPAVQAEQATPASPSATTPAATTTSTTATTTTVPRTTTTTLKAPTTTSTVPATTSTTSNAAMVAIANAVKRSAPSNDEALLAALVPLQKLGYTAQQAAIMGMGQFPVAGPAYYTDDWLEYRATPTPHNHMGIDIDATLGTPIRSPIAGTLRYDTTDPDGYGLAADVTGPDKTEYVMAHMSATVKTLATGSTVTQGEVVGYVGESGDATGPHLHFEVHPQGGAGIDGKPMLDAWQAAAIKALPALITSLEPTTLSSTTTSLTPQVAIPRRAAFSPPLPNPKKAAGSLAGLALVGLLALFATSSLSFARFRPRRAGVKPARAVEGEGPDGPPEDLPMPAH